MVALVLSTLSSFFGSSFFKGALGRWIKALANIRVIIAIVVIAMVWGAIKGRSGYNEGSSKAVKQCKDQSSETIRKLEKEISDRDRDAQEASDSATRDGFEAIDELKAALAKKEKELEDAQALNPDVTCGWTSDDLN